MTKKNFIQWGFKVLLGVGFFTYTWAAGVDIPEPTLSDTSVLSFSMKRVPTAAFFEEHPGITSVIINEWSSEGAKGLNLTCFDAVKEHLAQLPVSLHLNDQGMEAIDVVLLSRSLSLFPKLKVLDLSNNSIELMGVGALTGGLMQVKESLEELFLRNLGPDTLYVRQESFQKMGSFEDWVKGFSKLKVLDFSHNECLHDDVVNLFTRFIKNFPLLEELYLDGTQVDEKDKFPLKSENLNLILDNIGVLKNIKKISFSMRNLTDDQRKKISDKMDALHFHTREGGSFLDDSRASFWATKRDKSVLVFCRD